MIVPTLCVVMPQWTLRVRFWDAERPGLHSHAERGNDRGSLAYSQTISRNIFFHLPFQDFRRSSVLSRCSRPA
ncbi:hypothetical protein PFAS1_02815 [Pseudomonas frederiksbergensis]|nr:hypothetical protein PFAS1_02815 [Pseudomonas frederiksbergensis]